VSADSSPARLSGPLAVIAELTHRCPLHCVYCSNPLEMAARAKELLTEEWTSVFRQAVALGVLQIDFTGGEPLARADLTALIASARGAGLYVSLITSGIGLTETRLAALVAAGLEHLQLSFQDSREDGADAIAGTRAHAHKLQVAGWLKQHRVAFTMNVVVHRQNLERLPEMIALAEELGPGRLEVAHTQYYGWALANREALLPTRAQLDQSLVLLRETAERLKGRIRVEFVVPDYYARYPKACMGGWGRKMMLITPVGRVLPCHAAEVIPDLTFESVRDRPLREIWEDSASFRYFRGDEWMPEPCRSCDRRAQDHGGCRCQALLLAGDATATDPVCSLAPAHGVVEDVLARVNAAAPPLATPPPWRYRPNPA
jgi:pyrroloquinoline quinone biosynthesis protein E